VEKSQASNKTFFLTAPTWKITGEGYYQRRHEGERVSFSKTGERGHIRNVREKGKGHYGDISQSLQSL
jgi:hypothetical protein